MATQTYLKQSGGQITEVRTVETSAGSGDANKIPSLTTGGILDDTILNASATSSANKVVKMNGSGIIAPAILNATITSAGAGDSGKLPQLDSSGRIDTSVLPVGVGPDSKSFTTTEVIAAGAWVNIWNSSGVKVRNADASNGRQAHCFTILGAGSGASCVVYFEGANTAVSSKTVGATQFLSSTTPGASTETAPSTAGQIIQVLGVATAATEINAEIDSRTITLA